MACCPYKVHGCQFSLCGSILLVMPLFYSSSSSVFNNYTEIQFSLQPLWMDVCDVTLCGSFFETSSNKLWSYSSLSTPMLIHFHFASVNELEIVFRASSFFPMIVRIKMHWAHANRVVKVSCSECHLIGTVLKRNSN